MPLMKRCEWTGVKNGDCQDPDNWLDGKVPQDYWEFFRAFMEPGEKLIAYEFVVETS